MPLKLIICLFVIALASCSTPTVSSDESDSDSQELFSSSSEQYLPSSSLQSGTPAPALGSLLEAIGESGVYITKDSVAAYLCKFDKLPGNYVGKNEGKNLYESETGNSFSKWNFNPWTTIGVVIGGDVFENYADASNYHATLPEGSYREADVDYSGANRGTKRLVYQSDCVIYYTADHYETFDRLNFD